MNVLIVDDDRFVVAALKDGLDWDNLGYTNIYIAYNISDAMSIIESHTIDLLLCDIDMPHGSGLDLLSWIRGRCQNILAIFLTNYANFEYAQKALELKSFHYFLKPIEYDKLEKIIRNATLQLTAQNVQTTVTCEHFWHAFIHEEIIDDPITLENYFVQMQLPYTKDDIFLPVIYTLFPYCLTDENNLICNFSHTNQQLEYVKATFYATFENLTDANYVFIEYNHSLCQFLAVFRLKTNEIPSLLLMDCETFSALVSKQFNCILNCFIGLPSFLPRFHFYFNELRNMIFNSLELKNHVILLSDYKPAQNDFPEFDTKMAEFYLENAQYSAFLEHCHQYLHMLAVNECLHYRSMTSFQVDISQLIYGFLNDKGILANKLFQGSSYNTLSANAKYALHNMEMYLRYIITIVQNHLEASLDKKTVAKSIKEYVNQHYAEDITRNCLTDVFFLDEIYASKIFKKETGISFKNYIIQKRIEAAKELLQNTDLPINTIADNVGYGNYSYFSRLFKKVTNMTPIEYRNQTTDTDNKNK